MMEYLYFFIGTGLGGGMLKSASVYVKHREKTKTPALTEEQRFERELMAPLTEPDKTIPEHCELFIDRIFERRLLEAGVIRQEDMSVCMDGLNCIECRPTVEYKNSLAKVRRDREKREREAEAKVIFDKHAQDAKDARARKYHNERWQEVTTDSGRTRGYIHEIKGGSWEFESADTGKKRIISATEARRYCKACWTPLRNRVCERGCAQPIPADRKRAVQGYMIHVPEEVPYDAYGAIDREYNSSNERFFTINWKWIDPETGRQMSNRSMHPRTGFEGKEPTAIERASVARTHNQQKQLERAKNYSYDRGKYDDYKRTIDYQERRNNLKKGYK